MLLLNKLLMLLFDCLYDKLRYDGNFFVRNLDTSMEQSTKRGKRLHRTQYIQYCTWAHALMVRTDCCGAFSFTQVPDFVKSKHAANVKEVTVLYFSLQKKEVGPEDAEYSFLEVVLKYIRNIAPRDVKGEIREVCLSVSIHTLS